MRRLILLTFAVMGVLFAYSQDVETQTPTKSPRSKYDVLDIKKIASMLIAEKKSGQIDDMPFVAYWESLGFQEDSSSSIYSHAYKLVVDNQKPIIVQIVTQDNERRFELSSKDHRLCWYLFIRLKDFGLKGSDSVARGKGLTAVAGADYLRISYKLSPKVK